jgi:hypothetical protein
MRNFRWVRLLNIIMLLCFGYYVYHLYEIGTIIKVRKAFLIDIMFAAFFSVDLMVTLISKETFTYFYGINKAKTKNLYRFCVCFEMFMIIFLASMAMRSYLEM